MKDRRKRILSAFLAGAVSVPIIPFAAFSSGGISADAAAKTTVKFNLNEEAAYTRTIDEIKENRQKILPENPSAPIYSSIGSNEAWNHKESTITETTKENVLKASNYYRWLAGLSGLTFTDDAERWEVAAKGAVLLSVSNFDHNPDKPADMTEEFYLAGKQGTSTSSIAECWGEDQGVLIYTLQLFLNDDGFLVPGHRNTFLTRNAEKLAYGMFTKESTADETGGAYIYSCQTVIVKDGSKVNVQGTSDMGNDETAYAWPAPGNFPAEELSQIAPWTINLNTDKVKFTSSDDIKVTITDTDTGKQYIRTTDDGTLETSMYWGVFLNFTSPSTSEDESYLGKTYRVDVTGLKDAENNDAEITYEVSFFSYDSLENVSSMKNASTISIGDSISIDADAKGGNGNYLYSCQVKKGDETDWTTVSDYSSESSFSLKTEQLGKYNVKVIVKDKAGDISEKEFTVNVNDKFSNISYLSSNTIDLGKTLTLYGASAGGKGTKTYAFFCKKDTDSDYTAISDFSEKATVTFTPEETGYYNIIIQTRDDDGREKSTIKKQFTIYVYSPLVNKSTVVTNANTTVLRGSAQGGDGNYRYEFFYRLNGAKYWKQLDSKDGINAYVKGAAAGEYEACIRAYDGTGAMERVYSSFKVKVLANKSICAVSGKRLVLKGSAVGGVGTYKYAFYYQKPNSSTWRTIRRYTSSPNAAFALPTQKGTYTICMKVMDESGKVSKIYLKLRITSIGATIS